MAKVSIRGLCKAFGAYNAVADINLEVAEGEFVVLLGPSGCGKSTLLRMLAGLEMPTSGDIQIGDRLATRLKPKDRNIAMVFQNYALYPHLTIYENIAFPLRVHGVASSEIDKKVRWAASLVDIERLLQRKPRHASGGERQRTALARSLVRDPDLFLLDEPLSNLDAKLRHTARDELKIFQKRVGLTSIYVTHDQVEAMGLGDRIVVMEGGRIHQIGTPEDIYQRSADTFVATFIGSPPMNLIDDGNRKIGFRPETFLPESFFGSRGGVIRIPFRVDRIEYLGGERLLYGVTQAPFASGNAIARLPISVDAAIRQDTVMPFAVLNESLRFFDSRTGLATDLDAAAPVQRVAHV
ncbi:ABC transporter ATP-binding protein [Neorhizobium sp. DT-125]|uniref:ABC transporter ATP-binding protein n=1 Tax=Neorhizobium sp. DT-125 TaxID=3396163 RepID=UPI003F1C6D20